jgi:tetratricopeptide (TPR) repeat protein
MTDDPLATIDLLLAESRSCRYSDPSRMVYLAELAQAAANRLDGLLHAQPVIADVHSRVWAELGNAYRLADELDRAEAAFGQALDAFERGSRRPVLITLIAERFAALLCHRRRFPEALALLERLASHHLAAGHRHLAGRALVIRGAYAENAGDARSCLVDTARGVELLTAGDDPDLLLSAVHNLLSAATDLGHFSLASRFLPRVSPLYGEDRLKRLRLRWLEARIATGLGERAAAEEAFREAREGFAAAGLLFPTGLVTLDLALLLAADGRNAEIASLAEEMVATFQALQVGREGVFSLLLLGRACREGEKTSAAVAEWILELKRSLSELGRQPVR